MCSSVPLNDFVLHLSILDSSLVVNEEQPFDGVGVAQPTYTVSTDCLPSSHSTAPPLPSDVEHHSRTLVHPSHSPNITSLNFCVDLVVCPLSSHMHYFLRPSSLHSGVPPDDVILCSSITNSSLVVSEEQPIDIVGVSQPTCTIIHEEYEWDLEHQH